MCGDLEGSINPQVRGTANRLRKLWQQFWMPCQPKPDFQGFVCIELESPRRNPSLLWPDLQPYWMIIESIASQSKARIDLLSGCTSLNPRTSRWVSKPLKNPQMSINAEKSRYLTDFWRGSFRSCCGEQMLNQQNLGWRPLLDYCRAGSG